MTNDEPCFFCFTFILKGWAFIYCQGQKLSSACSSGVVELCRVRSYRNHSILIFIRSVIMQKVSFQLRLDISHFWFESLCVFCRCYQLILLGDSRAISCNLKLNLWTFHFIFLEELLDCWIDLRNIVSETCRSTQYANEPLVCFLYFVVWQRGEKINKWNWKVESGEGASIRHAQKTPECLLLFLPVFHSFKSDADGGRMLNKSDDWNIAKETMNDPSEREKNWKEKENSFIFN